MSCVNGIHERLTSSSWNPAAALTPRMSAMRLAGVRTRAFGRAGRAGGKLNDRHILGARLIGPAAAPDGIELIDQECARAQRPVQLGFLVCSREAADALEQALFGIEIGR